MKRKTRKTRNRHGGQPQDPAKLAERKRLESRRRFVKLARNFAIGLPVVAGMGYFGVQYVQATISEADLTKIGNGRPAIVQIHDAQCASCHTLQRQSRKILKSFEEDSYTFLVANIKTKRGLTLARRHGVGHVTLLLFDGQGQVAQIVRGPIETEDLRAIITAHLNA